MIYLCLNCIYVLFYVAAAAADAAERKSIENVYFLFAAGMQCVDKKKILCAALNVAMWINI